jgi:transcriptional regulator with XRE-family HTH domain
MTNNNHPAIKLGEWLKEKRKEKGLISRVFAGEISLSPSKYAEVEFGIIKWIARTQEHLIPAVLAFTLDDLKCFTEMLARAKAVEVLKFSDVFTREQLEPIRLRTTTRKKLTEAEKKKLLDAVFAELV